jgi:hypothetical protein
MSLDTDRIYQLRVALRDISLRQNEPVAAGLAADALERDDQARIDQLADERAADHIASKLGC